MAGPFARTNSGLYIPSTGPWVPPQAAFNSLWLPLESDATDASGNGYDFDTVGTPTYELAPGGTKNCLRLNGISDYLSNLDDARDILPDFAVSWAVWIYPETWGHNNFGRLLSQGESPKSIDAFIDGGDTTLEAIYYNQQNNTPQATSPPNGSIALNTWRHVAYICQSGEQRVYLDGSSVAMNTTTYTQLRYVDNHALYLGDRYQHDREFKGYFSNAMIWKEKVLTGPEIVDVMTNTSPL